MKAQDFRREREIAVRIVRDASRLCRAVQTEITPEALSKADKSPVTVADFGSQALICRALEQEFPSDPIIAEEDSSALRKAEQAQTLKTIVRFVNAQHVSANEADICRWIDRGGSDRYSDRFWTLDPIDGTKGFLRREQYAVALALVVEGRVRVAALGCPNLHAYPRRGAQSNGCVFVAVEGCGAVALPLDGEDSETPIQVSDEGRSERAKFCESVESGHSSHDEAAHVARILGICEPSVRLDSQAKYAVVARGEAEIYLRLPTRADYREKIWDHAAGALIVTEAGGKVTDIAGKPLEFHHGRELAANRGVIVANAPLHSDVLAAIAQIGIR